MHIALCIEDVVFEIKLQKKHPFTLWTFFKTYYNYLTIDCWYLIKYVLQTRLPGIISFRSKATFTMPMYSTIVFLHI